MQIHMNIQVLHIHTYKSYTHTHINTYNSYTHTYMHTYTKTMTSTYKTHACMHENIPGEQMYWRKGRRRRGGGA